MINFFIETFVLNKNKDCIIFDDKHYKYSEILEAIEFADSKLNELNTKTGEVISIEGDFNPISIGFLFAAIKRNLIIVPLTESVKSKKNEFKTIAQVNYEIIISNDGNLTSISKLNTTVSNELLLTTAAAKKPGLVLFSSGSTGNSKAALHDLIPFLEKFKLKRHSRRAISFLLFDHIGGLNTLLYTLSNGGTLITVSERTPFAVLKAIQNNKVEVLPTSPTFLNLLILSELHNKFDLSSLKLITYGTEMMPSATLTKLRELLPEIELLQTYGLSEVGILRSKSESSDSLWVKIGGDGFETRVVNNMLEIKANSAMLGYLNAPSPFTPDGWFITNDLVEVKGEYFKFLGRKSDIINIGGEKVYPAEVESEILKKEGVIDVIVTAEKNALVGNIIVATVKISESLNENEFRVELKKFLLSNMQSYKVPQKIIFTKSVLHTDRFKRSRNF